MQGDTAALLDVLGNAEHLAVITGAGCSTASGIGDYRDANGDWKRPQPVQHNDFLTSEYWRRRYWIRSLLGYPEFRKAQPNAAHRTLADWEARGKVTGLITQNVDGLHQRAGHRKVIDLHGRPDQVVCLSCHAISSRDALQDQLLARNPDLVSQDFMAAPDGDADVEVAASARIDVPACGACGGLLKPNVVFYGAAVPRDVVDEAYAMIDAADAVLVVGSSLMVYSSFRFVRRAAEQSKPVVAINIGRTRADELLIAKVAADCSEALPDLDGRLQ